MMKIAIIALVVCMAGFAVAAPTDEIMGRGFWDTVYDMLGLGAIKDVISALHGAAKVKFMTVLGQVMTKGTAGIAATKQILADMVTDIKEHGSNGGWIFSNAADKMTEALNNIKASRMEERALVDTLLNIVGFNDVKEQIKGFHSALMGQFTTVLSSLMFSGKEAWADSKKVLANLHTQLSSHVGSGKEHFENAVKALSSIANKHISGRSGDVERGFTDVLASVFNIGDIWGTIQTVSGNMKTEFVSLLTSLFLKGSSAWGEAQIVFQHLHENLKDHAATKVVPAVQQAINELKEVLAGHAANIIG